MIDQLPTLDLSTLPTVFPDLPRPSRTAKSLPSVAPLRRDVPDRIRKTWLKRGRRAADYLAPLPAPGQEIFGDYYRAADNAAYAELRAMLQSRGHAIAAARNPYEIQAEKCWHRVEALLAQFGLTPASRKGRSNKPPLPEDDLDALLGIDEGGNQ